MHISRFEVAVTVSPGFSLSQIHPCMTVVNIVLVESTPRSTDDKCDYHGDKRAIETDGFSEDDGVSMMMMEYQKGDTLWSRGTYSKRCPIFPMLKEPVTKGHLSCIQDTFSQI